ncbi:MAG: glycosyltransferase family 2 protein, partial [Candidatus Kryptoniota bacterium]
MNSPLVYIIILNWNGKDYTASCLDSISKVNYPRFVTVVVDNGSSDGSVEYISRSFPWVKVVANTNNLRFAGGNNIGIDLAIANNADYVLLLNNDTVVHQ